MDIKQNRQNKKREKEKKISARTYDKPSETDQWDQFCQYAHERAFAETRKRISDLLYEVQKTKTGLTPEQIIELAKLRAQIGILAIWNVYYCPSDYEKAMPLLRAVECIEIAQKHLAEMRRNQEIAYWTDRLAGRAK